MSTVLYDFPASIYCQFVRLTLVEKGVSYERRHVDITRPAEQFEADYLVLNPRGVVPTLVVDGTPITDGVRIIRFIEAEMAGPCLVPTEEDARAEMDDWIGRATRIRFDALFYDNRKPGPGVMGPKSRLARLEALHDRNPCDELGQRVDAMRILVETVQDVAMVDGVIEGYGQTVKDLDARLAGRDFIAGDAYSLADIIWTATLGRLEMAGLTRLMSSRPNVCAYYERMKARDSFETAPVVTQPLKPSPVSAHA
jgi:glutathione S-transferase